MMDADGTDIKTCICTTIPLLAGEPVNSAISWTYPAIFQYMDVFPDYFFIDAGLFHEGLKNAKSIKRNEKTGRSPSPAGQHTLPNRES